MLRKDDLLGLVTISTVGMIVAIAFEPLSGGPNACLSVAAVATGVPLALPFLAGDAATSLRRGTKRFLSWLAARKRIAADHDALVGMSDRELIDIGLDRASVNFVSGGGHVHDYPF
jgi:uncharacterized protein YjiS (DUF1127 family)